MKTLKSLTSACRYCRHYKPEGRRGGMCQMLEVSVHASWKACALALPVFAPAWEGIEGIMVLDEMPVVASCQSLVSALDSSEQAVGSTPERKKAEPVLV